MTSEHRRCSSLHFLFLRDHKEVPTIYPIKDAAGARFLAQFEVVFIIVV